VTERAFPWLDTYAAERLFMTPRAFGELCKRIETDTGLRVRRKAGRNWILTEQDWLTLQEHLPCPSSSSNEAKSGTSAAPSEASQYAKAQKLLTGTPPTKSASNGKAKSSVVAFMARPKPQVLARPS